MQTEWVQALPRLRQQLGERNFQTWIEPIRCTRDDHGLRLEVASRFFQEWVSRHFLSCIRQTLAEGAGASPTVRIVVVARPHTAPAPIDMVPPAAPPRPLAQRSPRMGHLVASYTFETFVVGDANEVAYRAARSLVEAPGTRFNPFFLWGGVGLGKTHLVNALAHELLQRSPRRRMACLSAESFMNTLITSLRQDQMNAFRERFRALDVLILDDIQFLAGKERTQEEFFHTFNVLYASGRQIVLTSDKPPHAIAELEQRLRSRFEGGLIADVHPPTAAMRISILKKKAELQGINLPDELAQAIAQRSGRSVREMEGALNRVLAASTMRDLPLTCATVEQVLPNPVSVSPPVSVEAVQEAVSQYFRLSIADLKSQRRDRPVTQARQIAMYLSRTIADVSFPSIAEKFGGRDHSTVIHAVRAVEQRRSQDPDTGNLLSRLEDEIRARQRV